ncbi:hypothetical protein [Vulcanisaeta distributa]|uniref:Uncharacterized protein n=1 Tax=Vulcanisaeta distributa (strain DSM 14429 / JCM 11212 / NBRC 100878 / IC-017) TaxID=572478 RepID=E1QR58_VULDI|nr:hypothetical protein [Vulcanisaeta distributa]ADN51748.1 conserved hypothetical protein [Vulcanisaeta distributa DSM 14429]
MSGLDKRVYELHSRVMSEFMGGRCYDVDETLVIDCIRDALTDIGLSVNDVVLFDIDGNVTNEISNAKYVRVTTTSNYVNGEQIFTFALIKLRNKYRVLYLQSAVKEG